MPLERGSSQATISRNVSEMVHAGHPQNQAVAAAMRAARQGRADGGAPPPLGAVPEPAPPTSWMGHNMGPPLYSRPDPLQRTPIQDVVDYHQSLPGTMSQPTVGGLESAFHHALAHHLSLDPAGQRANSKRANARVAQHIGPSGNLLSANLKLKKASGAVEGYDAVELPDGRGVETTGSTLSPSMQVGDRFNTCPNSASCRGGCLGITSGHNYLQGSKEEGVVKGPGTHQANKTMAMMRNPEAFAVRLHNEITSAKRAAAKNGNKLGVRLNVLSDLNPRIHKALIQAHPDVDFYDYTKNNTDPVAPNHHYTYSSTGVSQPAGEQGLTQDVFNPHQNWKQMRKRLDAYVDPKTGETRAGSNVAMAFSHKKHLPETVFDHESGKTYRVVDGDTHDFRPLDRQEPGADGVIIGLRNKDKKHAPGEPTVRQSKGFFVHYDPQEARDPTTKKMVPTNTQVAIHPQAMGLRIHDNDQVVPAAPRAHTLITRRRAFGGAAERHITDHEMAPEHFFQQFPHAADYTEDDVHGGRPARREGGGFPKAHMPKLFHPNVHHLHVGPIHSAVHGRTDHLPMHVPSGSYVIPADVVSAHGEGNTMAGFKVMRRMFGGSPYGGGGAGPYNQGSSPYGETLQNSRGGRAEDHGGPGVPIVAAGGEFVLSPAQVRAVGNGDADLGTKIMDEFVKRSRAKNIKTLQKLPGPARD